MSSTSASSRAVPAASLTVGWLHALVLGAMILAVYWGPIRGQLVDRWITDGNWSHGWLIPLFSIYFLVSRREALGRCRVRPSYWGAVILTGCLALYVGSSLYNYGYPQAVTIVGVIFGATLLVAGWDVMRIAWFPILFLLLAVPLPRDQYVSLTRPLRELASTVSAATLPILIPGLHAQAQAVVIDYILPGGKSGQLNVEEACSGMRLMMAFVTLGVAMAYLNERPWWHRVVLLASCIPIAVFCNAVRVTTTGYFVVTGHNDLARGTPHQLLGMGMLFLALGMYALLGYVLNRIYVEVEDA